MSISSKATGLRPGVCTSTTRPSGPYTGQIIYETDTGQMQVWNGSSWGSLNPTANRNVIINGGMDVWQRGTSGFATTDGTYTADRWRHTSNNLTITRDTDVPTGFNYSAKLVGTSDNSFAQRIESINAAPLAGQIVTVSFYAKRTSGSGALDVRLYYPSAVDNFASNTQIGSTYVVSSSPSSSWTRYTYTVSSVLPANVANGLMLLINNTGAATTFITGVQLEVGTQASAFERRLYGSELALCQRYYEKSYNADVAPTTNTTAGIWYNTMAVDAVGNIDLDINFCVPKRSTVGMTVAFYQASGTAGSWNYGRNGASGTTTMNFNIASTNHAHCYGSPGGSWTPCWLYGHWVVNAEL